MRNNNYLDNEIPEDKEIGELKTDKNGRQFRIVNGKKIYQIEEKNKDDEDLNLIINRVRVSGMTPSQYLKNKYG